MAKGRPPLRVMIVEDSPVVRLLLQHIIDADPRLAVAAAVGSAEEAIAALPVVAPDVISMDIHLPGIDGFEATRRIMSVQPTPIVVISGSVEKSATSRSMEALRAGALAVVEKPVGVSSADYAAIARDITTQLVIMSQVSVVRRRMRTPGPTPAAAGRSAPPGPADRPKLLVAAASTGGPQALARVFGALPRDWPLPVLLVQHMGATFMEGFARWLDSVVPLGVRIAEHQATPRAGQICVAPGDRHLRLGRDGRIAIGEDAPIGGQRPAASALFASAADVYGPRAVGLVLTGMGEDGAAGVARMVAEGATVLAEDESSAIVNGMPAAAVRAGATALPIERMVEQLRQLVPAGAAA